MMELSEIIVLLTIIILSYFIYRYLFVNNNYWEDNGIPCVDGALPIIGHNWPLIRLRESYVLFFYNLYKSMGNRSMIGYYNFRTPGLIIRDPELIKAVMLTGFNSFEVNTSSLDPHLDPLLTSDPFFTAGEDWKKHRAVLQSALSTKKLKVMAGQLQNICDKFSNYIEKEIMVDDGNICVNIEQLMSRFTAEFVAIAAFSIDGKSFTKEPETFESIVRPMFQLGRFDKCLQSLVLVFPTLAKITLKRLMPKRIDNYFRLIVKLVLESRRHSRKVVNDFLQNVADLCQDEENKVDENAVTAHAASFFLDGYINSSVNLSFTAYYIAAHPEVQAKLREELMNVLGKYNCEITYESIQEMRYMDQVIYESMRLFPATPYLAKMCSKEYKLVGVDGLQCNVQPGTEIVISTIGLHRDPLFWDNPNAFDPERFSDDKKQHHKFIYLPFGSGPRICVGIRVAMMQMKTALATLLRNYSIEVHPKTKKPIGVHPLSGLFTLPNNKLWLHIKRLK